MRKGYIQKTMTLCLFFCLTATLVQIPAVRAEYRNPAVPGQETAAYWMDKGGLYSTYGNFPAAIRAYEKSLTLSPGNSEAYFDMGIAYGELGEEESALENISKAIRLDPANAHYRYGRAWILIRSGHLSEAQAEMVKAAEMGSEDARRYLKGMIDAGR